VFVLVINKVYLLDPPSSWACIAVSTCNNNLELTWNIRYVLMQLC